MSTTPGHSGWRLSLSVESLVLLFGVFWVLSANRVFFGAVLHGRDLSAAPTWSFAAAMVALVLAVHFIFVGLISNRWTVKPVLAVLTLVAALSGYFIQNFGVYLDPPMLRNVLHTHVAEARELLTPALAWHTALYVGVPLLVLSRVRVSARPIARALLVRVGSLLIAALTVALVLAMQFQPLASLVRNHRELRYLVAPETALWSLGTVAAAELRGAAQPRQPIGLDAAAGPSFATRRKPLVLVVVVGETARAANWGLSGYARPTTPELAHQSVINFSSVTSCGTNTEVSLPCLFSPQGRHRYDEARIRGQESLLHVAQRAGVAVHWRDNQSGCKGVCEGLPQDSVGSNPDAPGCAQGHCLDEGLIQDLDQRLRSAQGTQLWVLHMMGNHGPAYFRRHPEDLAPFQPECRHDELQRCTVEEIVNAYDNALHYTDRVLATALSRLQAHASEVDAALIYVSDHGESLGEHGLFLHGAPYAIAPQVQTQVPMVMWFSPAFASAVGIQPACLETQLQREARRSVSHDHVFHTVLGLLDIQSEVYDPQWDLVRACRAS